MYSISSILLELLCSHYGFCYIIPKLYPNFALLRILRAGDRAQGDRHVQVFGAKCLSLAASCWQQIDLSAFSAGNPARRRTLTFAFM